MYPTSCVHIICRCIFVCNSTFHIFLCCEIWHFWTSLFCLGFLSGPPDLRRAHSKSSLTEEMQRWNPKCSQDVDFLKVIIWSLPMGWNKQFRDLSECRSLKRCQFFGATCYNCLFDMIRPYWTVELEFAPPKHEGCYWWRETELIEVCNVSWDSKLSQLSGAPNALRECGQGTFPLTTW